MSDPCPDCNGTGWELVRVNDREEVRRCSCAESDRRSRRLANAAIPERYRHCTLDSFDVRWNPADATLFRARKYVTEFVATFPNEGRGLLLMGPVGTGKTHLAVAALQLLILDKGVSGRFTDFSSLILEIQMSFDGGVEKRPTLEPLISTDVLVLDELGAGKPSPWVMDLLYYLVNQRYLASRSTIFTTNYRDPTDTSNPSEEFLSDRVSRRIRSRLFEMCQKVELSGDDYRKHRYAHRLYEKNA